MVVQSRASLSAKDRRGRTSRTRKRSVWQAALDSAALVGFCALFLNAGLGWAVAGSGTRNALVLAVAFPIGILLADFVTGIVHWLGDTFFDEETPILGDRWIRPFREHHRDPLAITRHSPLEIAGSNCLLLLALLAMLSVGRQSALELHSVLGAFGWAVFLVFCLVVAISNQLHCWAHSERVPAPIQWLQRHGLALAPAMHARHHRGRHDRSFCVVTGWCNPLLDRVGLLSRIERRITFRRAAPARDADVSRR